MKHLEQHISLRSIKLMLSIAVGIGICGQLTLAITPDIAEVNLDRDADADHYPEWLLSVAQHGGDGVGTTNGWHVSAQQPYGTGRLSLRLDRAILNSDVALTILYDEQNADLAVQLYDSNNEVVVVDVFHDVITSTMEAETDTLIIPLKQYPTASQIVLRRLAGDVSIKSLLIWPVATGEGQDLSTLKELADLLGDPLSPDNPLVQSLNKVSNGTYTQDQWQNDLFKTTISMDNDSEQPGSRILTPPKSAPVLHYTFDAETELKGTAHGVTNVNGALEFDGKNDYFELEEISLNNTFSICMTMDLRATDNLQCFIGKHTKKGGNIFLFGYWVNGYHVRIRNMTHQLGAPAIGRQHLVVTGRQVGKSSTKICVYRNGKRLWSHVLPALLNDHDGRLWVLGQDWDENRPTDFMKGTIEDLQIYNDELSASEVLYLSDQAGF
ncbi:MAG: LamG domain-containing protein [Spartobacteria bacterium]|nr:LamG domain-containing protein [Spartobacteria bacterium]